MRKGKIFHTDTAQKCSKDGSKVKTNQTRQKGFVLLTGTKFPIVRSRWFWNGLLPFHLASIDLLDLTRSSWLSVWGTSLKNFSHLRLCFRAMLSNQNTWQLSYPRGDSTTFQIWFQDKLGKYWTNYGAYWPSRPRTNGRLVSSHIFEKTRLISFLQICPSSFYWHLFCEQREKEFLLCRRSRAMAVTNMWSGWRMSLETVFTPHGIWQVFGLGSCPYAFGLSVLCHKLLKIFNSALQMVWVQSFCFNGSSAMHVI